jgi:hypothetical protein
MNAAQFLLKLANDPELVAALRDDLEGTLRDNEVDEEGRRLLLAGSIDELRFEIRTNLKSSGGETSIIWIHHIPWLHLDESS